MKTVLFGFATFLFTAGFSQSSLIYTGSLKNRLAEKERVLKEQATSLSLKDSTYYSSWDLNATQWADFARAMYGYTASGKENSSLTILSMGGVWYDNERQVNYSFDANNNLLGYETQGRNSTWDNTQKNTYTYDNADNCVTELVQGWAPATNSWRNNTYITNTYDNNHNLLTSVKQQWSVSASVWINNRKETATYNTNNEYTSHSVERWNNMTSSWESFSRYLFTYSNGNLTDLTEEVYDPNTSAYRPVYRVTHSYDGNHRLVGSISQEPNATTMAWENKAKETYTYNSNGNQTVHLNEKWDRGAGAWQNSFRQSDYYSSKTLGLPKATQTEYIRLYPNPATDHIGILNESDMKFTSMSILDVNGKQVQTQALENTTPMIITISALTQGIYMLELKSESGPVYKKLIKN